MCVFFLFILSCYHLWWNKDYHNDVIVEKVINIDENSRTSRCVQFPIRRQSSWASCELCSHAPRVTADADATQLDSCVASAVCTGHLAWIDSRLQCAVRVTTSDVFVAPCKHNVDVTSSSPRHSLATCKAVTHAATRKSMLSSCTWWTESNSSINTKWT